MKLVFKDVQVCLAGGFVLLLFLFWFFVCYFVLGLFYFVRGFFIGFVLLLFFLTHEKVNTKMTFFLLKTIIYL